MALYAIRSQNRVSDGKGRGAGWDERSHRVHFGLVSITGAYITTATFYLFSFGDEHGRKYWTDIGYWLSNNALPMPVGVQ